MNSSLRKYDENRDVYIPPEIDTWYQLRFDRDSGYVVILHYDRSRPLIKDGKENYYEMRRVVQRASKYSRDDKPSAIYSALRKVLDNYNELRANRNKKEYHYKRRYKQSKEQDYDLTDVAYHLKRTGMPEEFLKHFFHVEEGDLIVRPVVTQADINKGRFDIKAMEEYVWSLKELADMPNFVSKKKAGWYPDGKPPVFTKYKKHRN